LYLQYKRPAINILVAVFFLKHLITNGLTKISIRPENAPSSNGPSLSKPIWRGVSHQYAFFVSIFVGIAVLYFAWLQSSHGELRLQTVGAVGIFALSVSLLFGTSALYHRVQWGIQARAFMRRCDHASIYLLISGTYTPIMLLTLGSQTSHTVLAIVWGATAVGIFLEVAVKRAPKWLKALMYVAIGWVGVAVTPQIYQSAGIFIVLLIAAGGCLYTIGAAMYALKKPNSRPTIFGYHEYFHLFVIAGAVAHYVVVILMLERLT